MTTNKPDHMPLVKVVRHGFVFWEAPHNLSRKLSPIEKSPSILSRINSRASEYRHRRKPDPDAPPISVVPAIPEEITNIQRMVIEAFKVPREDFFGRNRTEPIARARIASMVLCRAFTERTVEEIGEAHNRHHRLVCHATIRFAELQRIDPNFAAIVDRLDIALQKAQATPAPILKTEFLKKAA